MGNKDFESLPVVQRFLVSAAHHRFITNNHLARTAFGVSIIAFAALLSACSSSTPTTTSIPQQLITSNTPIPTAAPSPTVASSPTAAPAASSTPLSTAIPTALDPCQLITSQEASALAGASFGTGTEDTIPGGGKTCTYGSQTTNIFFVEVVQAADEATAEAAQTQFLADLQAKLQELSTEGLNVTQVPDFADGAVSAQANINAGGETINGSAFGFRKGTVFFGFSDVVVGGAAPTSAAMQTQATTVLGRLP
jgi:hypothetical protein